MAQMVLLARLVQMAQMVLLARLVADGADGADGAPGPSGPPGEDGEDGAPGTIDPGAIAGAIEGVINSGVLADIHHLKITRGSNDKSYYYLAPSFNQGGDKEDGSGNKLSPLNLIAGTEDMLTVKAAYSIWQTGKGALLMVYANSDPVVSTDDSRHAQSHGPKACQATVNLYMQATVRDD